jgi:hypothetical protein
MGIIRVAVGLLASVVAGLCGGCAQIRYASTKTLTFENEDRIWLIWVGPDKFIYVPDTESPFAVIRKDGKKITPGAMYTDGGSIPRALWAHVEYSPWRFVPGFIIHDWLFEAKHCDLPDANGFTSSTATDVLSECVKTQMERNPKLKSKSTLFWIDTAVRLFSGRLWKNGKCDRPPDPQIAAAKVVRDGFQQQLAAQMVPFNAVPDRLVRSEMIELDPKTSRHLFPMNGNQLYMHGNVENTPRSTLVLLINAKK